MRYFNIGDKIEMEIGGSAQIIERLGEGGQGVVYKVIYMGTEYALKWYFNGKIKNPKEFRNNLQINVKDGSPSDKFLWPLYLTCKKEGSFGYLMKLRPKEFSSFPDILNANVKFSSFEAIVNAALNLANGFRELHRAGKVYQDINDGGFFVNIQNGDILICDCDNASPQDALNFGIAGKPGYMAPEVVMGDKPNNNTDKFSLAVVLFRLLLRGDPLEGEKVLKSVCLTEAAERKHYGSEPVFVYDPNNLSNRPVRGVHNNVIKYWSVYPDYIRDAFITSFTDGMLNPNKRLVENTWQKLFIRLKSEIITCLSCGSEMFASQLVPVGADEVECKYCKVKYKKLLVLDIKSYPVSLLPGVKLYACHTSSDSSDLNSEDYMKVTGEVIRSKSNAGIWGIRNLSPFPWYYKTQGKEMKQVDNQGVIPIFKDTDITFDNHQTVRIISDVR